MIICYSIFKMFHKIFLHPVSDWNPEINAKLDQFCLSDKLAICIRAALLHELKPLVLMREILEPIFSKSDSLDEHLLRSSKAIIPSNCRSWRTSTIFTVNELIEHLELLQEEHELSTESGHLDHPGHPLGLDSLLGLVRTPIEQIRTWSSELKRCPSKQVACVLAEQLHWLPKEALWTVEIENARSNVERQQSIECYWREAQPCLIDLPHDYNHIFWRYGKLSNKRSTDELPENYCSRCGKSPRNPSICLICGSFLCFSENCCVKITSGGQRIYECVQVLFESTKNFICIMVKSGYIVHPEYLISLYAVRLCIFY